jgi:hypothetical protein
MLIRKRIGDWRFAVQIAKVAGTIGLNSVLMDGSQIAMWGTDSTDLKTIYRALVRIMLMQNLPPIYIFRSHPGGGYHALCLTRISLQRTIHLASALEEVDLRWLRACMARGYFTLRITGKNGREPEPVAIIPSSVPEEVRIDELVNYDRYPYVIHRG